MSRERTRRAIAPRMVRLPRLTVRGRLWISSALFVAGFAIFAGLAFDTQRAVQVTGPLYQRIIQDKDVIADVLPPPEYIIESYLVALQLRDAIGNLEEIGHLAERSRTLRNEYDDRHRYWIESLPVGELRDWLVVRSYEPAMEFFKLRDDAFIPAVVAGDPVRVAELLNELRGHYGRHREAIDQVVRIATEQARTNEAAASALVTERSRWLLGLGLAIVLVVFGTAALIARAIVGPLERARAFLAEIADGDGDLTRRLEVQDRKSVV